MKNTIIFLFVFGLSQAYSQDTLVLKITNMQTFYEPCMNHWVPCGTILYGKLPGNLDGNEGYTIYVTSTETLKQLPRNSSSIYRVVLRKRYTKSLFGVSGGEEYSLMDIKSAF